MYVPARYWSQPMSMPAFSVAAAVPSLELVYMWLSGMSVTAPQSDCRQAG